MHGGAVRFLLLAAMIAAGACVGPEDNTRPVGRRDTNPTPPTDVRPDTMDASKPELPGAPDTAPEVGPPPPPDAMDAAEPDAGPPVDVEPEAPGQPDGALVDMAPVPDMAPMADMASPPDAGAPDTVVDMGSAPDVAPIACSSNSECGPGVCSTGICRAESKLVLYWTMDDQAGAVTATDSSGNRFDGMYVGGADMLPAASSSVPATIKFPDPSSRTFLVASRQAARLPMLPAALKPANDLTLSAWFRSSGPLGVGNGSEVVSGGDHYSLRVMAGELEFSKRTTNNSGSGSHVQVRGASITHLDGNWHHLAGVATPQGMRVYLDGVLLKTNEVSLDPRYGRDLRYDRPVQELWVGRHPASANYDFNGDIDDVRVYGRALTDPEILWLASGKP